MRVLVTGGAGYIGAILVPEFLKTGHEVVVVDNFMYGQTSLLDCCFNDKLTLIRGDVRDKRIMAEPVRSADVLVPLACLVGAPLCERKPEESRSINLEAVKMLLELGSRQQMVLSPTTNSGYGVGQKDVFCTEETPMNPVSLYGRLKVELERHLLDSGHAISLRL